MVALWRGCIRPALALLCGVMLPRMLAAVRTSVESSAVTSTSVCCQVLYAARLAAFFGFLFGFCLLKCNVPYVGAIRLCTITAAAGAGGTERCVVDTCTCCVRCAVFVRLSYAAVGGFADAPCWVFSHRM